MPGEGEGRQPGSQASKQISGPRMNTSRETGKEKAGVGTRGKARVGQSGETVGGVFGAPVGGNVKITDN